MNDTDGFFVATVRVANRQLEVNPQIETVMQRVTSLFEQYVKLQQAPMYVRDLASLGEKEFFICFSMTVMGLVTVIEWEMLFPDRRDYANLTPLPIRLRTMFGAKIAALLAFLAIFSLVINAFSPVMFPAVVIQKGSVLSVIPFARCHIVSILAANTFVF